MPAADLVIRPVAANDYAAWLPLWQGYQLFYEVHIPETVTATTWPRLLDPAEPVHAALAWQGDVAIGLVQWVYHRTTWSEKNDCYLSDLFVSPEVRGSGAGRGLIEHVYQVAGEAGCVSVHWLTHESNVVAQHLYNHVGERSGFIQYCQPL